MKTILELIEQQKEFDSAHKSRIKWDEKVTDKNIELLEFLIISLVGEIGEAANIVKKIHRGDFLLKDVKDKLSEEVIDILIYILKISYQLDLDIEKKYEEKMNRNKKRFKNYETKSE